MTERHTTDDRRPDRPAGSFAENPGALPNGVLHDAASVLGAVAELLGWPHPPQPRSLRDARVARRSLARAWQGAVDRVSALAGDPTHAAQLRRLMELSRQLKDIEDRVSRHLFDQQALTARAVHDALRMLRGVESVDGLVEHAPIAAHRLGFDRVVLSRIAGNTWVPESASFDRDPSWADDTIRAGRQRLRTLDSSLLETQIVRRNQPLLVNDPQQRPMMHRELIEISRTRSYTAAPITQADAVIGFVHADCYHQQRNPGPADRDTLWTFCDGLGYALASTSMAQALQSLGSELDRVTRTLGDGGTASHRASPAAPTGQRPRERALTGREQDVMELMSHGESNPQIARRLVLSEGTVKSHVKHILRKLGAANRAEAVSRWLNCERGVTPHAQGT